MKQMMLLIALLLLPLSGAFAEGGHSHGHSEQKMDHAKMGHDSEGKQVELKGELMGLTCFLKHGSSGDSHKNCAKDCAEKGLPIGLKTKEGDMYIVAGDGHDSLVEAYKPLLKYLEGPVVIRGKAFEKNGTKMVVIEKIKKG